MTLTVNPARQTVLDYVATLDYDPATRFHVLAVDTARMVIVHAGDSDADHVWHYATHTDAAERANEQNRSNMASNRRPGVEWFSARQAFRR